MNHTPGPWTWRDVWGSAGILNARRLSGPDEESVLVPNTNTDIAVGVQDANLIAAAPDLLEAARLAEVMTALLDHTCADQAAGGERCTECLGCGAFWANHELRRVIAKAEGAEVPA